MLPILANLGHNATDALAGQHHLRWVRSRLPWGQVIWGASAGKSPVRVTTTMMHVVRSPVAAADRGVRSAGPERAHLRAGILAVVNPVQGPVRELRRADRRPAQLEYPADADHDNISRRAGGGSALQGVPRGTPSRRSDPRARRSGPGSGCATTTTRDSWKRPGPTCAPPGTWPGRRRRGRNLRRVGQRRWSRRRRPGLSSLPRPRPRQRR